MIPPSIIHGLATVGGLRRGRGEVKESAPVKPVAAAHAAIVFPFVSRQVRAMVEVQLLTGMRPGEVVLMRGCDLDTTGAVWAYKPAKHKTQHYGINRIIHIGPKAQEILRPWLRPDLQAYLFSPAEAEIERRAKLHEQRKTPMSCGNKPGSNRASKPVRAPGARYTRQSYQYAIYKACAKAFPYPAEAIRAENDTAMKSKAKVQLRQQWRDAHYWSPSQLRHTAATEIRKEFGIEAAQTILGHTQLNTTEIYAEKNIEAAKRIMERIG